MPDLGMVPGLDELGIWELVGDWWSDAARPAPEADVRVAPPAGDDLHVDERAPPEGAVPATEEAIAHPAELALDPNEPVATSLRSGQAAPSSSCRLRQSSWMSSSPWAWN